MAKSKKAAKKGAAKKGIAPKKHKTLIKKGKKKWFTVKAPECLNSVELGEIAGFEPNDLTGRTLEITMKELTGSMRDTSNKFKLRVVKVQGDTAQTEPILFYVQNSHVQRIERRAKERIIVIIDAQTKSKENIRVKTYVLLQNKVARQIRTSLQEAANNFVTDFVSKREAADIFGPTTAKTISNNLKKILKKIYPAQVIVWKIKKLS